MLGWQIFVHSVRMVIRNWRQALRIGLIPSTLIAVLTFIFHGSQAIGSTNQSWFAWFESMSSAGQAGFALVVVGNLFVILWVFVAWHRFVLLEEYPNGWIPPLHAMYLGQYLKQGVKVLAVAFVVSFLISFVCLLVLVFLTSASSLPRGVLNLPPLVSSFISFFVVFRLGITFPATAIGQTLSMKNAYYFTKGKAGSLLFLAIVQLTGIFLAEVIIGVVASFLPMLSLAADVVFHLFFSLVHVSVWTTMYGVFVEKRELA
ncbi:hypothetical protein [Ruegeria atlantica]|uniref:hypothetical protein n=1 Tax=Ruegeria atlantica TaxID=81569 RepID=UPI00147DD4EE|nr:hypothetical protein [Ruegeria atlantica]